MRPGGPGIGNGGWVSRCRGRCVWGRGGCDPQHATKVKWVSENQYKVIEQKEINLVQNQQQSYPVFVQCME